MSQRLYNGPSARPAAAAGRPKELRENYVEPSNFNMILAAACLVAGIGLGALGYHLLNGGARNAQRLRLKLTERERQALRLAGEGRTASEIAEQLGLSHGTVRNYLSECIGKHLGERQARPLPRRASTAS